MRKISLIFVILLLLVGCGTNNNLTKDKTNEERIATYLEKLENFEVRTKDPSNTIDNEAFDEFLDGIFKKYASTTFLSMHYMVVDYEKYGVEKPEVNCGKVEYAFDEEMYQDILQELQELNSFDFDSLSYRQQYDYETLEYSDYETILNLSLWKYQYLFSEENNITESLVSSFSDYVFFDKEALDDFITCLEDIDRYLDDCLTYTEQQIQDKIYLLDEWIDYVCDYCDSFVNASENAILTTFKTRLEDVDFINEDEKQVYIEKVETIVNNEVIPAYQKVIDTIVNYKGKAKTKDLVLKNISSDYAKATFYLNLSNNESLETTFEKLKNYYHFYEEQFVKVFSNEDTYIEAMSILQGEKDYLKLDAKETLEYLREHLNVCYPDLGDISYNVDYLSSELGNTTIKAYYHSSPIDDYNQNIIRINPNNTETGLDTYITLAHEGFPGHLYQHVYALKNNQHHFRITQSFIGNSEGYAVMAQHDSLMLAGVSEEIADAIFFEEANYFLMYSIMDMGIHYFDWSYKDIINFFCDEDPYGLYDFDKESAEFYYDLFIELSGIYTCYGGGFVNMMELRDYAKEELGESFSLVEFNDAILKNGSIPFNILRGCVEEYVESKK